MDQKQHMFDSMDLRFSESGFYAAEPFLPHGFVSDGLSMKCVICGVTDYVREADEDEVKVANRVPAHKSHILDPFEAHMFQFDPNSEARTHDECRHCGRAKDHANHQDFSGKHAEWASKKAAHERGNEARKQMAGQRRQERLDRVIKDTQLEERFFWWKATTVIGTAAFLGGTALGWLVF